MHGGHDGVCMCDREIRRERPRNRERESEFACVYKTVCIQESVCVCVCVQERVSELEGAFLFPDGCCRVITLIYTLSSVMDSWACSQSSLLQMFSSL